LAVRAYADLRAYHAFLPDFGEAFHEPGAAWRPFVPPAANGDGDAPHISERSLTERLEAALRLQQGGRLPEAEIALREVLRADPNNVDATHLLGVLAHQAGRHDVAIDWIRRALELAGPQAVMLNNLGEAYRAAEQSAAAVACYHQALQLAPGLAPFHNNLGLALHAQGDFQGALRAFDEAVRLNAGYAKAHRNRGRTFQELGRMSEAMASYDRAREVSGLACRTAGGSDIPGCPSENFCV
jgi:tetratricopeptide (TPR) repeat protein